MARFIVNFSSIRLKKKQGREILQGCSFTKCKKKNNETEIHSIKIYIRPESLRPIEFPSSFILYFIIL